MALCACTSPAPEAEPSPTPLGAEVLCDGLLPTKTVEDIFGFQPGSEIVSPDDYVHYEWQCWVRSVDEQLRLQILYTKLSWWTTDNGTIFTPSRRSEDGKTVDGNDEPYYEEVPLPDGSATALAIGYPESVTERPILALQYPEGSEYYLVLSASHKPDATYPGPTYPMLQELAQQLIPSLPHHFTPPTTP